MNQVLETFTDFWEVLTGVYDDNRSKLIRLLCFALLAFGAAWAALNYFQADKLSDTEAEIYSPSRAALHTDDPALKRIADLARTVQTMRQGSEAIATAIARAHTKPFNIDGYNEMGLEGLGESLPAKTLTAAGGAGALSEITSDDEFQPPEIFVRAIMRSGKKQAAVIDTKDEKGILIRRGDKLPNDWGRVTKIRADEIITRIDGREVIYRMGEIENALKKKKSNAGGAPAPNANAGGAGALSARAEKFLFEGTVPENSALAPSTPDKQK